VKYDLTRVDIDDLDDTRLAYLVAVGEPLDVGRKRGIPEAASVGELIGSMANTDGG
jgi:hypothetical protein